MIDEWSEEVNESRTRTAYRLQKRDLRFRRQGQKVPQGNSGPLSFILLCSTAIGIYWWRTQAQKAGGRNWKSLPIISFFARSKRAKKSQQSQRYQQVQRQISEQNNKSGSASSSSYKKKSKKKKSKRRK
eukprot:TRINITY_DN7718_c0_g2_i11.p2 TRINITY_DN7718_c0_g2~~TRINITY_DN7718_c0_g2_i11.p2  ORF type:complete len:129 (-),score=10.96 TRINITY_DN7718_c0_g2_i11:603-989(-)